MYALNELINNWLDEQLLVPKQGTLADKWREFALQEEYEWKSLPEFLYEYFEDEGYTGTITEKYNQWLNDVIYAPPEEEE